MWQSCKLESTVISFSCTLSIVKIEMVIASTVTGPRSPSLPLPTVVQPSLISFAMALVLADPVEPLLSAYERLEDVPGDARSVEAYKHLRELVGLYKSEIKKRLVQVVRELASCSLPVA
jgi:hypothetical protein